MVLSILWYQSLRRAACALPSRSTPRTARESLARLFEKLRFTPAYRCVCQRLGLSRRGTERGHKEQSAHHGAADEHEAADISQHIGFGLLGTGKDSGRARIWLSLDDGIVLLIVG